MTSNWLIFRNKVIKRDLFKFYWNRLFSCCNVYRLEDPFYELLVKSPKMSLRAKRSNPDVDHKLQFSKDRFVAPLLAMTCFSTFYELLFYVIEKLY